MSESSWLDVNMEALDANVASWRAVLAPPANRVGAGDRPRTIPRLCAVIKADGYGIGAAVLARRLVALSVDMLAVYSAQQAADIAPIAARCPLLVLQPVRELSRSDPLYRCATMGWLHLTVHDLDQLYRLDLLGKMHGCKLPIHLFLDTGMSRSGMTDMQFIEAVRTAGHMKHVRLAGVMSHLATADSDPNFAFEQMRRLDRVLEQCGRALPPDVIVHLANTAATACDPRFHRDMVRVGLGLHGWGAPGIPGSSGIALEPLVRWRSRIVHVQRYAAGSLVGYHGTHRLAHDSILAVVPVGYADGYPLALSNQAVVTLPEHASAVGGKYVTAPIVGKVSMDQMVIDVTTHANVGPGTLVELISNDVHSPCALPRLAEQAQSCCHELLTRLGKHLPRKVRYGAANVVINPDVAGLMSGTRSQAGAVGRHVHAAG